MLKFPKWADPDRKWGGLVDEDSIWFLPALLLLDVRKVQQGLDLSVLHHHEY